MPGLTPQAGPPGQGFGGGGQFGGNAAGRVGSLGAASLFQPRPNRVGAGCDSQKNNDDEDSDTFRDQVVKPISFHAPSIVEIARLAGPYLRLSAFLNQAVNVLDNLTNL
jgi:hypothetical protein